MADAFYVRVRGKISGPFDLPTLQKLVRRGTVSRVHEISSDRASWNRAGEFEDLFPAAVAVAEPEPVTEQSEPPVAKASAGAFCYMHSGSTAGPVPLAVLKQLVQSGSIGPEDLVWREGSDKAFPAIQVSVLAPLFGALPHGDLRAHRQQRENRTVPPPLGYYAPRTDLTNVVIRRRNVIPFLVVAGLMLALSAVVAGHAFFGENSARPLENFSFIIGSTVAFLLLAVAAVVMWLMWLHGAHSDLKALTDHGYSISPGKAVGFSFIPFFDLFWVVYMPWRLASELNRQLVARSLPGIPVGGVMACQIISIPFALIIPGVTASMYAISMLLIQNGLNRIGQSN